MTETNNSLFAIHPYVYNKTWVFDDEARGLVMEPFVAGADTLLDKVFDTTVDDNGNWNFSGLVFSSNPIPNADLVIKRTEDDPDKIGTDWYVDSCLDDTYKDCAGHELWLCPALYEFFDEAPERIYIAVQRKGATKHHSAQAPC